MAISLASLKRSTALMPARILLHGVAGVAEVLNREEKRAEAADALRSLVDRIELTPNDQGKLEIDLFGDLAGILTLAGNKKGSLDESAPSVQQVKMVAGARSYRERKSFSFAA